MAVNRYTQLSTSKFDPLSLEEVLAVPLYKQKQFDALEEARIKQADMFKVNPLDVHKEEAARLNKEYMDKVDALAQYQNKTGDIQGAKSKLLDLQRDYKKLTDPMGKVSQINTATNRQAEAYKQWMETDDAKKYGPEVANKRWLEHVSRYKGYDDKGNIVNIGQMQAPAYQNLQEDIKDLKGMIGSTELTTAINNGFSMSANPDGSTTIRDGSGNVIEKTNNKQLVSAYNFLKEKWFTPTGEGFKSAMFAGQTPQSIYNRLNSGIGMMSESSRKDTRNDDYSVQGVENLNKAKKEKLPQGAAYNLGDGMLFDTNQKLMKELGIGSSNIEGFTKEERSKQSPFNAPLFKINQTTTSVNRSPEYKKLASSINRTLPANQKFKEGSKEEDLAVRNYLSKYGNTVIKNRIIDPFADPTGLLFADKTIGKEANAAQVNLWKRVSIGASKMVDKDGNEIPLGQVTKFNYNGDLTPESNINVFKEDKRQNYLAHTGTVTIGKGEDAEVKQVYISRNSDDFDTPLYKGAVDKNKINNIVTSQPNIYHHFKTNEIKAFKNHGLKDVEIKYNEGSGSYDLSYTDSKGIKRDNKIVSDKYGTADEKFSKLLIDSNQ